MTAPAQPARDLAWAERCGHEALGGYAPDEASFTVIDQRALRLLLGAAEDAGRLDYLLTGHGSARVGPPDHPFICEVRTREDIDAARTYHAPERVARREAMRKHDEAKGVLQWPLDPADQREGEDFWAAAGEAGEP
jgi:hypothetical protein